jgi:hypothetical protein
VRIAEVPTCAATGQTTTFYDHRSARTVKE